MRGVMRYTCKWLASPAEEHEASRKPCASTQPGRGWRLWRSAPLVNVSCEGTWLKVFAIASGGSAW